MRVSLVLRHQGNTRDRSPSTICRHQETVKTLICTSLGCRSESKSQLRQNRCTGDQTFLDLIMKLPVKVTSKKSSQKDSVDQENINNTSSTIYSLNQEPSVLLPTLKLEMSTMAVTDSDLKHDSNTVLRAEKDSKIDSTTLETRIFHDSVKSDVFENIEEEQANFEARQTSSRASSVYDDSGFNSSASEDKDDIEESPLNIDLCSDLKDINNDEGFESERTSVCEFQISEQECSTITIATSSVSTSAKSDNDQSETVSKVSDLDIPSAFPLTLSGVKNVGTSSVGSGDISLRTSLRRRRTDWVSPVLPSNQTLRLRQLRRRRHRDCNNNDTRCRDLQSYLGKAPFRLIDCFQERGLLSLAACIAYTLTLVILCGFLGFVMDCVKSGVGKENLKDMRDNIVQSRRSRSAVSSG